MKAAAESWTCLGQLEANRQSVDDTRDLRARRRFGCSRFSGAEVAVPRRFAEKSKQAEKRDIIDCLDGDFHLAECCNRMEVARKLPGEFLPERITRPDAGGQLLGTRLHRLTSCCAVEK